MLVDRDDLACQLRRLATGRGAEVERPFPIARANCEPGKSRSPALRPDTTLCECHRVHTLYPEHARHVSLLAVELAANDPNRRLRRLVLGVHERNRLIPTQVTFPDLGDPVGVRELQRAFRQRVDELSQPLRETAHDGIRERHGALEVRAADELDALVHRCVAGHSVEVRELVRADP